MHKQKKIKLLFRHRSMEMGGVEKVMLSVIKNLSRERFEITVCLNLDQGELRNEFPSDVRKVVLAKGKEDFSKNSFLKTLQLLRRNRLLAQFQKNPAIVDEKFLKGTYDIEIGMTYNDFDMVLHSSNPKSRKVGWFHSEINLPKLQPLVTKILENFPKFDMMIYCSQRVKDMMHQHYPDLKYPLEQVIINAIPIQEIKEKAEQQVSDFPADQQPVFVSIGRLHTRKGYHLLMEAHSRLLKEGLKHRIIIIGDGEEMENLLKQKSQLGVGDSFLLLGNKMNPYPYLKKADFFIMPSESEAWPLVLAEALILQKPSIATNTGDVATMLQDGQTGLLIQYSVDDIQNAMKTFLTQPEKIQNFKENLKDIESRFNNQQIFDAIEEVFINLAEKS